jgi:hypothetical protein
LQFSDYDGAKEGWHMENVCRLLSLKKIMVKNRYPLPRIDDLLDQLKNVAYFTKLDLRSGYHHIRVAEHDAWKTDIKTK